MTAPAAKIPPEVLLGQLHELGLVSQERLGQLPEGLSTAEFASRLIDSGDLTRWQAERVLSGHGQDVVLGKYTLLELLGRGGMGEVFQARHGLMNRNVALKVIHPEIVARPDAIDRFRREIQILAGLSHPNIVTAHDAEIAHDGRFILVMEYCQGRTLGQLVREVGPLPVALACWCVREAAAALQYANEQGLIHRDIKPENLIFNGHALKLLDFGLARLRKSGQEISGDTITQAHVILGTADYIAPEQALDQRKTDTRSDIYSLGCTLYFLLSGQVPFPGGTLQEKILRHQTESPLPVEAVRTDISSEVCAVVRRMMSRDPQQRFQSPADVATALTPFAQLVPVATTTATDSTMLSQALTATAPSYPASSTAELDLGPARERPPASPASTVSPAVSESAATPMSAATLESAPTPKSAVTLESAPTLESAATLESTVTPVSPAAATGQVKPYTRRQSRWGQFAIGASVLIGVSIWLASIYLGDANRAPSEAAAQATTAIPDLRLQHTLEPHPNRINQLSFSGDSKLVAVACGPMPEESHDDRGIVIWDVASGNVVQRLGRETLPGYLQVAFSPRQDLLAAGTGYWTGSTNSEVQIWEPRTGERLATIGALPEGISAITFSPEGRVLLTVGRFSDGHIRLWNVETLLTESQAFPDKAADESSQAFIAKLNLIVETQMLTCAAFSPKGDRLAVGTNDGRALLLESTGPDQWKVMRTLSCPDCPLIYDCEFSPDGSTLAVSGGKFDSPVEATPQVSLWRLSDERRTVLPHPSDVWAITFSRDGEHLLTGEQSGWLRLWDLSTGKEVARDQLHGAWTFVTLAPDGTTLATGGEEDRQVEIWSFALP